MKEIKYIILYLVPVPDYGSGSTSQKVTVTTVPVQQRWLYRIPGIMERIF